LDLEMPGWDGFETLKRLRQLPDVPANLRVMALTAHAVKEVEERCRAEGFDGFITKPIKLDTFAASLAQVM
jgi:CheY-like chemotaxis protein